MRKILASLISLSLLGSLSIPVTAKTPEKLTSTTGAIASVIAANLMRNFPDGGFYPERFVSRGELATIMVKAFQLNKREASKRENVTIGDVPATYPAHNDIQTVLKNGIMEGYRNNLFFPNQQVSRAEAIAIFSQAYGVFQFPDTTVSEILSIYPDQNSIPTWARKAIATATSEGFIEGDTQGNLQPQKPMTRGAMATLLNNYLQRQQKQPETPIVPEVK
ncbi:S-layer homology domain-containing protein [Calothrix sp. PCC 6303]|uniref:S-layer homology domain-containing protein n=1 Tax=Calothrix sp. PCC 6303 TaxID=1170562 RepID=UPI0002A0187C|nr:S-layer homology domain-containing protein [Calothrix sp. PCC 6303]AFZ00450.1 S-layer domain-containing protein [Calothrix sp. PCC 6303]